MKRCIESLVSTPLALALLKEEIDPHALVKITAKKGEAIFTFEQPKTANKVKPQEDKDEEMTMGV